jgi:hypothetical protein
VVVVVVMVVVVVVVVYVPDTGQGHWARALGIAVFGSALKGQRRQRLSSVC